MAYGDFNWIFGSYGFFLAKSYVFFFFLIHFMVVNLFYVEKFSRDRKTIQKKLFIGVIRIFSY